MILLVAAEGRGGGGGDPVFFTVPWSPMIAKKGQLPGSVFHSLMSLHQIVMKCPGGWGSFHGLSDGAFLMLLMAFTDCGMMKAASATIARTLLTDLGLVDGSGPQT